MGIIDEVKEAAREVKTEASEAVGLIKSFLTKTPTWRKYLYLGISALLCGYFAWVFWPRHKMSTATFEDTKPIPATKSVPKQEIAVKKIIVYKKEELCKKIELPPEIKDNPNKEVTATAALPPSDYGTDVMSVVDKESGGTEIKAKAKERPFFSFEKRGSLGVRAGMSTKDGYVGEVYVRQDLFQVKGVYVSLYGAVEANRSGNTNAKAMLQVDIFRW